MKCFGLTIDPERLAKIRNERRPNSVYASLENCRHEVREGESMMRRSGIDRESGARSGSDEIRANENIGDTSPHPGGRAQPGDVLGVETGGERTYVGDTSEDENKRRRDAEEAANKR